jgi:hypothetical protein
MDLEILRILKDYYRVRDPDRYGYLDSLMQQIRNSRFI